MRHEDARSIIIRDIPCTEYLDPAPNFRRQGNETIGYCCPYCGSGTHGRNSTGAAVYYENTNKFFCHACGKGGGTIDAYRAKYNCDYRTAFNALASRLGLSVDKYDKNQSSAPAPVEKPKVQAAEEPKASPEVLDKVYKLLLGSLTLSKKHHSDLRGRGLTDEMIKTGMYKTNIRLAPDDVERIFKGIDLSLIPGFYKKRNRWRYAFYGEGILIPIFSVSGLIVGIQIRRDEVEGKKIRNKYIFLSSNKEGGTKAETYTSFVNRKEGDLSEIILTEGPLKGSIINFLTGTPVIAIPGVTSQKYLIPELTELKKQGLKKVVICFDMDYKTKKSVKGALTEVKKKLTQLEIPYILRTWDDSYKGYDDFLASKL